MNVMNSFTHGLSVSAAMTSPPMVTGLVSGPPSDGKSIQSIVVPGTRALLTWPVAMPPTKPPS